MARLARSMAQAPSPPLRLLSAPLLLLALCLLAAGCGSSTSNGKLLSGREASDLRASLTQVEQDVAAKDCTGATDQINKLEQQIDAINRLDGGLRSSLRSSVRRLQTLVSDACQTTASSQSQTNPDTGTTGATGATGTAGTEGKKEKKPKQEKPPKENGTPPGQGGQTPPGQQDGGGGAGVPGESNNSNGNGGN
jgi:hypothetical protein